MGDFDFDNSGFEDIIAPIIEDLEEFNQRFEVAKEWSVQGRSLRGESLSRFVDDAAAAYTNAAKTLANPFYEPKSEYFEVVERTEEYLKEFSYAHDKEFEYVDFRGL